MDLSDQIWIKYLNEYKKTNYLSIKNNIQLSSLTPALFNRFHGFMEPVDREYRTHLLQSPFLLGEKLTYLELFPLQVYNSADLVNNRYFGCKVNC